MNWRSRILQSTPAVPPGFRLFATPVYRGSTILFEKMAHAHDEWHFERGWNYGLYGTPTSLELAARIAELEGGAAHVFSARRAGGHFTDLPLVLPGGEPCAGAGQCVWAEPEAR